jgi:hypothetical protein
MMGAVALMDWIGIAALVVSVLLWLFNPSPIRRWLGLEKPPPLPPYYVAGSQVDKLRRDPLVAPVLPADESRLRWVLDGRQARAIAEGFSPLLTEAGEEIRLRSQGSNGDTDSVLMMARPQA